MRVALIASALPPEGLGGSEAYAASLARELATKHDVLVLSGATWAEIPGVELAALPGLRPLGRSENAIAKTVWHLQDQWLPSIHRAVRSQLRRFAPHVVHTNQPQGLSAAVFTALAADGLPHVHTAHDLNLLCMRITMTSDGEFCGGRCTRCRLQRLVRGRLLARHVHRLIANSDYIRNAHISARLVPAERVMTIRYGVEAGTTRVRTVRDPLRLGFIGTLAPHKGISTLLDAFRSAPSGWCLDIAGAGPLEEEVRAVSRRDPRITIHGYLSGADKDSFFDSLDLLVIPSEYEEAATLVAVEAAVRGLPSVVSDRGGLPETPEARIFRARDPQALGNAVAWFLSGNRLAKASRRLLDTRKRFLLSTHVAEIERVFEEAVRETKTSLKPR
jgi:glycosyltransferase involved in cell wall biosynthesis